MHDNIEVIKKRIKEKRSNLFQKNSDFKDEKTYISKLFTRVLLAIIFTLTSIIYINYSNKNLLLYKEHVLNKNISFGKINSIYKKYFGKILPLENIINEPTQSAFNEKLTYTNIEAYLNGSKLTVSPSYAIPIIESGIVVFTGEKEGYKNTIIIQGIDGVDIWYGNIKNSNLKLYDYIEKGTLLGETNEDILYLILQKNGEYLSYEDYEK